VLGFEADFDYADIDGAGSGTRTVGVTTFTTSAAQGLTWLGTVRGRLGFTLDHGLLLYGTGGLAYGRTSLATAFSGGGACGPVGICAAAASTAWQTGWAAGAGIEWAFSPSFAARIEYLHYDLGSRSLNAFDAGLPGDVFATTANFAGDIVRFGLDWRFGGGAAPIVTRY
jgi:outer membrane immunogenic protein